MHNTIVVVVASYLTMVNNLVPKQKTKYIIGTPHVRLLLFSLFPNVILLLNCHVSDARVVVLDRFPLGLNLPISPGLELADGDYWGSSVEY